MVIVPADPSLTSVRQLCESGWLSGLTKWLWLNTGTGLKYPEAVLSDMPILASDQPVAGP